MKSLVVFVNMLVTLVLANNFSPYCPCNDVDTVIGLTTFDIQGLWFIQNIFFDDLYPATCKQGILNVVEAINCSFIQVNTLCLSSNETEVLISTKYQLIASDSGKLQFTSCK